MSVYILSKNETSEYKFKILQEQYFVQYLLNLLQFKTLKLPCRTLHQT